MQVQISGLKMVAVKQEGAVAKKTDAAAAAQGPTAQVSPSSRQNAKGGGGQGLKRGGTCILSRSVQLCLVMERGIVNLLC